MKKELYDALTGDAELVSLVGRTEGTDIPCIFFSSPRAHNRFPAVTFFECAGTDSVFADDVCIARSVVMQVEVWAEGDVSPVFDRVDAVMRRLDYSMSSFCDVPDVNVRHVIAEYKKII